MQPLLCQGQQAPSLQSKPPLTGPVKGYCCPQHLAYPTSPTLHAEAWLHVQPVLGGDPRGQLRIKGRSPAIEHQASKTALKVQTA